MTQILTLNPVAAAIMNGMTRLRVNKKTRGGVMYAAIRPSHRVAGRNPMIKVEPVAGESSMTAELSAETAALCEGLPELKNNHTYVMFDIGYGWWTLREPEDANDQTKPLITVAKGRKQKAASAESESTQEPAGAAVTDPVNPDTAVVGDAQPEPAADPIVDPVVEPVASTSPEVIPVIVNTATAESTDGGKANDENKTVTGADSPNDDVAAFGKTLEAAIAENSGEPVANTATAEGASTEPADEKSETTPAAAAGSAKPARVRTRKAAVKADAEVAEHKEGEAIVVHVIR
jgi:hypothetical protein